jgi:16S rRNA (uracil1498-N3)-methyltransferase
MKEVRFFYVPDAAGSDTLPDEEAQHALRVLRLKAGDALFLMDGQGTFYEAEVTLATGKKCLYALREALPQEKTWQGNIHLAIAPTKMMERMEWLAEKATEVGFDRLTFLDCRFSERRNIRTDRVDKIVVSATKQSRKAWKPAVEPLTPFKAFVEQDRPGRKYIAHCYEEVARNDFFELLQQAPAEETVTVLVGPEGDFSIDEVQWALDHGYESVSLGNSRLRTETAGLMAVTMAQILKRTR